MITKRILLFGGSGSIGKALRRHPFPADWELRAPTRAECDFAQPADIGRVLRLYAPALVINAAEMNDIDRCEADRDRAMRINFDAVAHIAGICVEIDAPLIQLSTDQVFDGEESARPYLPADAMNPVNAYGASKMMSEEAARHGTYGNVILRLSRLFGADGDNILTQMLSQIDTQDEIAVPDGQTTNPTGTGSVARALVAIGEAILNGSAHGFGTFHLCDAPAVSLREFTQTIIESYAPYSNRRPRLVPRSNADPQTPRPFFSALDCDKIRAAYGIDQRPWRDELTKAIKHYVDQRKG